MAYTDIDNPKDYFSVNTWTADDSSPRSFTGFGHQPDLLWVKHRGSASINPTIIDSVRGGDKMLATATTAVEDTKSHGEVTAFGSDGITVADGTNATYPKLYFNDLNPFGAGGGEYVCWSWKESATAGFDIVTWTGNGSNQTVSHNLSAVPHFMITKNRSATGDWTTYHKYGGGTKTFYLSNTDAIGTTSSPWNNTDPTSSVFTVGAGAYTNGSGNSIVGYIFTEKQGYSKFGSYTGNGNADGTFVYLGFRPAFLLVKKSSASGSDWNLHNNKSPGFNVNDNYLAPNEAAAEVTDNTYQIFDFCSNGFKCRGTGTGTNASGETMIYAAFAEAPFVNSKGVPCNAR